MRLRTMNRRRWRKANPPHVTQTERTRRTRWHIWKLHNIWNGRWNRAVREERELQDIFDRAQAAVQKGIVVL